MDDICNGIGYDPMNVRERRKVYNILVYWRKRAILFWEVLDGDGKLKGDFKQMWDSFINHYNAQYDAYYFLYDWRAQTYFQPTYMEKERMSQKRVTKQLFGIRTVLEEMATYGENLLATGRKPVDALKEAERFGMKYITDGRYKSES